MVVRQRDYLDRLGSPETPSRQIGEDLVALLAFAGSDTIVLAGRGDLQRLGLDAHVVGFEDYDLLPSLLADLEGWRGVARKAGPDLFATATSDVSVWVGVMPDGPRFEELKRVVRSECEALDPCVSPNVYRFRAGRWVVAE